MKELKHYEKACQKLADRFLFELECDDHYWVGGEVGGVLAFSDYFVGMNHIADYFKYSFTPDNFWKWYDNWIDEDKKDINMKNWKYLKGFNA